MSEIRITAAVTIDRPAADVWAVLADYRRDPEWRTGVEAMTPDPLDLVRPGTTTREVLRLLGRTWRNDGVVTDVVDGRSFAWRTTVGADAHGSRRVETLDRGRCRVHLELVVVPHGGEHLLRPVLTRVLRRNLRVDVERLRVLIERAHRQEHAA
ncbi:MAG TPA: SRPBCC family protein [Acidimicrobiia bacterium]|nr:SRPBCC family protein [Acidimicrobiia bacterium]